MTFSDNKTKSINVIDYIPEVYRSDVNQSFFGTAVDRHLSKDDSSRVAGFIGTPNPNATINRQIPEVTPHRQAYQLAPTMVSTVGTETTALSFEAFTGQLSLMGVDITHLPKWGNALKFNWVPPVNLDMLVNYSDYYWIPTQRGDAPQYITVESTCEKSKSQAYTFATVVGQRGFEFAVNRIMYVANQFIITGQMADIFAEGLQFNTLSIAPNLNRQWTTLESSYDSDANETTITVIEPIAEVSATAPSTPTVGDWWYNTVARQLNQWDGTTWNIISQSQPSTVSLQSTLAQFQAASNCACGSGSGWDTTPWDSTPWDEALNCIVPLTNQWTEQNHWVHKSEVQSTTTAQRAAIPILEFSNQLEMSSWATRDRVWEYRSNPVNEFATSTAAPQRFELEPIKGYVVDNTSGAWTIYLFETNQTVNVNIDHSKTFVPGYQFVIRDDALMATIYTVASSEYRELNGTDSAIVTAAAGIGVMCTVVTIVEPTFSSPVEGGGSTHIRIEPVITSQGDPWAGYHVHWLLDTVSPTMSPSSSSPLNVFAARDAATPLPYAIPPSGFVPAVSLLAVGDTFEQFTANIPNITHIDLVAKFKYNPSVAGVYATANSDELRVYVNGLRQYLTYTEQTATGVPNYTIVGNTLFTSQSFQYVTGITMNAALKVGDVVRIEVGPIAYADMGWYNVPVRTVRDETEFTLDTIAGTQPQYLGLTTEVRQEQMKTVLNQYPQYNMYDVVTGEVIGSSSLFAYQEGAEYPISANIQRRIVEDVTGKEFGFEQFLVDRSNNVIYAYRNLSVQLQYWYNPVAETVSYWTGTSWSTDILMTLPSLAVVARTPVIAAIDPVALHNVDRALWMDTTNNQLYYRDVTTGLWVVIPQLTIDGADPTLQTIWKHGTNNEQAIPQYVDSNRQPIATGSPNGSWAVVDQWLYNSEHKNYKDVLYSQLVTHCNSIINSQPSVPGLPGNGAFTLTQAQYNYGLGGTIHDYNGGFDTLISAVNVTNVTPIGVIEFAAQEYSANLLFLQDTFNKQTAILFGNTSTAAIIDFDGYVAEGVITAYETNDYFAQLYSDSSAYNQATGKGVRNWISTAPMFGLSKLYVPHLSINGSFVEVFHHDGHRSVIDLSAAEQDRIARTICALPDSRVVNGKFGLISQVTFPATASAYITSYGVPLRTGVYWYQIISGLRQLYRFAPYAITDVAPGTVDVSGTPLPEGTKYYNTVLKAVFEIVSSVWTQITATGSEDITPLWTLINFNNLLGNVYLEVDKRLYDVTFGQKAEFDFASLIVDGSDQAVYNDLYEQRFMDFVSLEHIQTPFVNTTYSSTNPLTWNYVQSIVLTPPVLKSVTPTASWQATYQQWYGTPYPNMEPWTIQQYVNKPEWWDEEYADTTGARLWTNAMWTNLLGRIIPTGRLTPEGVVSTGVDINLPSYSYFSVDTTTDTLLPPYFITADPVNRSLFTNYSAEIVAPNSDYVFGDQGPAEWQWMTSAQYPYDPSVIAFQMQPVKFLHQTFGNEMITVDELEVDVIFKQVYSHEDALFHGDLYDTNVVYQARGLNQWYVNYNRYTGTDTNGQFRQLWAGWDPHMTHQFGGIIDTSTFEISNTNFDVVPSDYQILLANSGVVEDIWSDAFLASLISIPPALVQYNNQASWKIELNSLSTASRQIPYYGTKTYPFNVDPVTDTFAAFSYDIIAVDPTSKRFYVSGDQSATFTANRTFDILLSVGNTGSYTVVSSVYESTGTRTRINVSQAVSSPVVDGVIDVTDVSLSWETGDTVVLSTSKFLPAPMLVDTPYYVIRTGDRSFKLADSFADALVGVAIDVITAGTGNHIVAQLDSSFFVFGGSGNTQDRWYHYALDRTDLRTMTLPYTMLGMQTLINVIDGYSAYQREQGILIGTADSTQVDPDTGRTPDWQVETERFINWAYGLRQSRMYVNDSYPVAVDTAADTLSFTGATPMWTSGTLVMVQTDGSLPSPLIASTPYYVVNVAIGVIKLSLSANATDTTSYVDILTPGSGQLVIGLFNQQRAFPSFEMNPGRDGMFIKTPLGILSNVIEGPYADIRIQQTIFDQYGRALDSTKLMVFRQDERSEINVRAALANDVDPIFTDDPYNYIHIGGAHLFVEAYEHYLVLNDYTISGALIYDQFYGLQASRFNVDYFEKKEYTLRPTLGGYYLIDGQFMRNIEGTVGDVAKYYDTHDLIETTEIARRSRALLGYQGNLDFLDQLGVNSKSQFLFYQGMIQTKGSTNSIKAFTNSRHFIDATVDEYWAYKVAEFGDIRPKVYPEIKLFSADGLLDDVRLQFLANSDQPSDPVIEQYVDQGFKLVSFADGSRWNNFPQQRQEISTPLFLDAEVSSTTIVYAGAVAPTPDVSPRIDYWLNTINPATAQLYSYNVDAQAWNIPVYNVAAVLSAQLPNFTDPQPVVYFRHPVICDDVRALRNTPAVTTYTIAQVASAQMFYITGNVVAALQLGSGFRQVKLVPTDGVAAVYSITNAVFVEGSTLVTVLETMPNTTTGGTISFETLSTYTTDIITNGTGLTDYTRINSESVRFIISGFAGIITIMTINPAAGKINPAKLIDTKAQTVIQQVPLWDPAKKHHAPVAIHNVDLQHYGDPAAYQFSPNPSTAPVSGDFWNQTEVGTVWLDTAYAGYVPYYDVSIYPDVNDRLYKWGQLAPWGEVRVAQWVESTVPPSQWSTLVQQNAADITIAQNDRASGTARSVVSKRTRQSVTPSFDTATSLITSSLTLVAGDQVVFSVAEGGKLPTGIDASTSYPVDTISGNTFSIIDPLTEVAVVLTDVGTGTISVVRSFKATDWITQSLIYQRLDAAEVVVQYHMYFGAAVTDWDTFTLANNRLLWVPTDSTKWDVLTSTGENLAPDVVDVYINGVLVDSQLSVQTDDAVVTPTSVFYVNTNAALRISEVDIIDIVRPVHLVTSTEEAANPDAIDDGSLLVQWKTDYQYSIRTVTTGGTNTGSVTTTLYYFWAEDMTTRVPSVNGALSTFEIVTQLEIIPTSYFVLQLPEDDPYLVEKFGYGLIPYGSIWSLGTLSEAGYLIPVQYRQSIIRKIASYLTSDDRFIIRFTRDWTLRDNLQANGLSMNLKDRHAEWMLFRREQTGKISANLWNRMAQAVSGFLIDGSGNRIAVPVLERVLYDQTYGTDTQYGLGVDQAFVNGAYGLATILSYLEDPTNDFWPINVNAFFDNNSFDTPANIASSLATIYNTFPIEHINGMWFETLNDAFATKSKYEELFKTSWIAVRGVRPLDVNGMFDE